MAKRMLIDATHPEETRVVVVNGNRLEEFDFESSTKQQVKGNIYLAKVTRVEPSLQAAFVDYGGNRHGFLAFSEIHPDYFRIPVGDRRTVGAEPFRQAAENPEAGEAAGAEEDGADEAGVPLETALPEPVAIVAAPRGDAPTAAPSSGESVWETGGRPWGNGDDEPRDVTPGIAARRDAAGAELPWEDVAFLPTAAPEYAAAARSKAALPPPETAAADGEPDETALASPPAAMPPAAFEVDEPALAVEVRSPGDGDGAEAEAIETLGGDEFEEAEHQRSRAPRHYKIQEVIKRRQIMLVQVTKEERGNKGAALTSYLSLAGRYCVLMPNTARGGGVSRKITSIADRRRLKDILEELDIPEGMGVIVRTAGAERSKAEIKRDYEYLLRLWNEIRDLTLQSTAPALIYEEGHLIKRSIRDLYTRDIEEVLVEGEEGYRTAKAFMKMLMPSHAKRVQPYRDAQIGLLHRFQIESQIDAIHSPTVQLRSGGYVVINQTEALVAIDVNSGRSTRERNIEETALRTNLEAAEEIARQLRLRDLAGLIVIDFIDMEEHRNHGAVERRLKDALKNDRARIQVGRISPFGLLEMSRQRLRPSLVEASTQPCPHCGGTGTVRSTESTALYVLRSIEEEGIHRRSAEVCVYVPTTVALYILNHKRDSLAQLETRYGVHVLVSRDDALIPPAFRLERLRAYAPAEAAAAVPVPLTQAPAIDADEDEEDAADEVRAEAREAERQEETEEERGRSRRRRRRRRRQDDEPTARAAAPAASADDEPGEANGKRVAAADRGGSEERNGDEDGDGGLQRRRRGRRGGGRRRGRREEGADSPAPGFDDPRPASETVEIVANADAGNPATRESESAEDEAAPARALVSRPENAAPETAVWATERTAAGAADFETASLPALAGEPQGAVVHPDHGAEAGAEPDGRELGAASHTPYDAGAGTEPDDRDAGRELGAASHTPYEPGAESEPDGPAAGREIGAAAQPPDYAEAGAEPHGSDIGARAHPRYDAEAGAAPVFQDTGPPAAVPSAESEPGIPFPESAAEARTESPASAAPAPVAAPAELADRAGAAAEKPENPRKGWWQRLIQS